jgi:cytoskeleton protein RodZ
MFEIGSSLRQARERRGLALADVQRETRIRVRYLQALEDERFDLLPGDAYVKGFLRSYAEFLGLHSRLYLDEYAARHAEPEEPELVARPTARLRRRGGIPRPLVVVVALAAAVGVLAWRLEAPARGTHERAAQIVEASSAAPSVRLVVKTPQAPVRHAERTAVLRVSAATGDCWLSVKLGSAGGKRIYYGFLRHGRTLRFGLRRPLWVRLGNPDALAVRLNGKPVTNLPHGTANVLIGAAGLQPA